MENILLISFRTILVLVLLFFLTKMMGKKQLSQMNIFDYTVGITIGSIAADISLDIEKDLLAGIICLTIYAVSSYLISYICLKSINARRFIDGVPTFLIENNKVIEKGLEKVKIDINTLIEEARNSGYFDLSEIQTAVMEVNGKISFELKEDSKPLTRKDMNLQKKPNSIIANIIIDERLMEKSLKDMNKTKKWLNQQLKLQGYNDYEGILLATIDNNEKLTIYPKNVSVDKKNILD